MYLQFVFPICNRFRAARNGVFDEPDVPNACSTGVPPLFHLFHPTTVGESRRRTGERLRHVGRTRIRVSVNGGDVANSDVAQTGHHISLTCTPGSCEPFLAEHLRFIGAHVDRLDRAPPRSCPGAAEYQHGLAIKGVAYAERWKTLLWTRAT
jgi:hypothetical protein